MEAQCKKPGAPLCHKVKRAEKRPSLTQCQLGAEHRKQLLQGIRTASSDDKQLCYKLVRKERGGTTSVAPNIELECPHTSQVEGWATYFEGIASTSMLPHFDEEHYRAMKMKYHLLSPKEKAFCSENNPVTVDKRIIQKHIKALKMGKLQTYTGLQLNTSNMLPPR